MYKLITKIRAYVLVWLTHKMALPLLKLIRKPQKFLYTKEDLQQMADGTLGKDLVTMLSKNNLELLPYYVKHDIKHILLEYDTTGEGEVCLQCFMLGNGHISFPVAATVTFGLFTMPEYWYLFIEAFKKGRRSVAISNWQWHLLLPLSTVLLKKRLCNKSLVNNDLCQ